MIIRSIRLRHGRIALPRQFNLRASRRWQSSLETSENSERASLPHFTQSATQQDIAPVYDDRSVPINDPNHPVAQDYAFFQHQRKFTTPIGTQVAPHYKPHELLTKPPKPSDITLELLIASQAHIGHATSLWNPANARYIFGVRGEADPIHIISPDATASHLRRACKIVYGVAERGGLILFVGTRQGQARAVTKAAENAKGCHLFTHWIPGSITNGQQILGRCEKLVVNELDEPVAGFEDQLLTKAAIKPDLVVCLNPLENYVLLHECGLNNIPTIGIIDTDVNPTWVTYPIPANDDSLRCVQFIAGVLGNAGKEGQEARLNHARNTGYAVYPAIHGLEAPKASKDGQDDKRRRPRQQRQPRTTQRSAPQPSQIAVVESAADELDIPSDLEGVDVAQHEADVALLEQAEQEARNSAGFMDGATQASSAVVDNNLGSEMQFSPLENINDEDLDAFDENNGSADLSEVDQSLIDETYAARQNEEFDHGEDMAQFGIHSAAEESPIEQVGEVEKELGEGPEGESPVEQVGDVEEELGEKAPEPEIPGEGGNPEIEQNGDGKKI